jgi:hypothetical protein
MHYKFQSMPKVIDLRVGMQSSTMPLNGLLMLTIGSLYRKIMCQNYLNFHLQLPQRFKAMQ